MSRHSLSLGVSLVELLVAMVLIGLVMVMASKLIENAFQASLVGMESGRDSAQARLALERITRELRMVRSPTAPDLTPQSNQITFVDMSTGSLVSYSQSGTTLNRTETPVGGSATTVALADGLNTASLAFSYLQSDGRSITLTNAGLVYYITVQFNISSNSINLSFTDTVKPMTF
jgi:Tfp pilus assembly protein PilV